MNLMTSKPLKSKNFYLDLTTFPNSKILSKDLELLGGKEVFSIPSASFVVSDRPCIKTELSPATSLSRSNSPHLFSNLDNPNSPCPSLFSPSFDQKHPMERIKPVSRGSMLLMKANEKSQRGSQKTDFVDLCRRLNVRIYPLQKVLQYIEKFKSKYLKNHKSVRNQDKPPVKVTKITPPFMKFEDAERLFKPKYKSLSSSKIVDSVLFRSVRRLVRNTTKQSCQKNEIIRPILQERSVMSQFKLETGKTETASFTKVPGCYSVSNMSVCAPVNTIKEGKDNQDSINVTTKKEKKKSKKQYCEVCQVNFSDRDAHFEKDAHKKFLNNSSNYEVVKDAIAGLPTLKEFLAKIESEDTTANSSSEDDIQLFDEPVPMESCSNQEESCNSDRQLENNLDNCLTEAYSLNNEFFVSPSCSTRSTPLPFLENDEPCAPKRNLMLSLSSYNASESTQSVFNSADTFSKRQELISYNSFITDHGLCTYNTTNEVEVITSPSFISFPNEMGNFKCPADFSCGSQIETANIAQSFVYGDLKKAKDQINALDYSKKNLLYVEQYTRSQDSPLPQGSDLVSSAVPLDLSCNLKNGTIQNSFANEADVAVFTPYNNGDSKPTFDVTKMCTENESSCLMNVAKVSDDNVINNMMINTDALALGVTPSSNDFLSGLKPIPLGNPTIENQINVLKSKLDEVSDTENYYDSDSDDDLNKMVSSCIEEVDKIIERNSPDPVNLNNQHLSSCNNMNAAITDTSANKMLNSKLPESPSKRKLDECSLMNSSPPDKRMRFEDENSHVLSQSNHTLNKDNSNESAVLSVDSAVTDMEFQPDSFHEQRDGNQIQQLNTDVGEEHLITNNADELVKKLNSSKSSDLQLVILSDLSTGCETETSANLSGLPNAEKFSDIGQLNSSKMYSPTETSFADSAYASNDVSETNKLSEIPAPQMTVQTSDERASFSNTVRLHDSAEIDGPPKIFAYSDAPTELSDDQSEVPPVLTPEINFPPHTVNDSSKTSGQSCILTTDENLSCPLLPDRLDAPILQETPNVRAICNSENDNSERVQDVEHKNQPLNLSIDSAKLNFLDGLKNSSLSSDDFYIVLDQTTEIDGCRSTGTEYDECDMESSSTGDVSDKIEQHTSSRVDAKYSPNIVKMEIDVMNDETDQHSGSPADAMHYSCKEIRLEIDNVNDQANLNLADSVSNDLIKKEINTIDEVQTRIRIVNDQIACSLSCPVSKQLEKNPQIEATEEKSEVFIKEMETEDETLLGDVKFILDSVTKNIEVVSEMTQTADNMINSSRIQPDSVVDVYSKHADLMDQTQKYEDECCDKMMHSNAITTSKDCDKNTCIVNCKTEPTLLNKTRKVDSDNSLDEPISSANDFAFQRNETSCVSSNEYLNGLSGSSNLSDSFPNEYDSIDTNFPIDTENKTVHIVYLHSSKPLNNACA